MVQHRRRRRLTPPRFPRLQGGAAITWFKVDDGLHSHRKAVRAGIPAMGLWVMAGSWCADNLTDGWLPDYIAMRLDRDYEENAKRLVQVGLWVEETRDGEPGWSFHEWNEPGRQPTKEQVLADRAAAADRQKRARDRAKERRERQSRAESQDDSHDRHAVTTPVTHAVSHGDVTPVVTVPPTRPDPTRPELPNGSSKTLDGSAARRQDDQLALIADAAEPHRHIKANDVVAAFHDGAKAANRTVTHDSTKKVAGTAKRLLEQNPAIPDEKFIAAAFAMGQAGHDNLNAQMLRGNNWPNRDEQGPRAPRQPTRHRMTDSRSPDRDYSENF